MFAKVVSMTLQGTPKIVTSTLSMVVSFKPFPSRIISSPPKYDIRDGAIEVISIILLS